MATPTRTAGGVPLDGDYFDYELARRGLTGKDLCAVAGIHQVTLSSARHGRRIRPRTLQRLASALASIPPLPGADLIVRAPDKAKAAGARLPTASQADASEDMNHHVATTT